MAPVPPEHHAPPPSDSPLLARDQRPVSVVHLVAELAPYARTGGLGEAVSSLATFQAQRGLPTAVVMPLYRQARQRAPHLVPASPPYEVQVGWRREIARLWTLPEEGPPAGMQERRRRPRFRLYFVENEYYFDRGAIYGEGGDYADNARRYAFFCAAALAALPRIAAGPLVLHAHDWHTALAPVLLRTWYASHPYFRRVSTVLSVHNAGFQGHYPPETVDDLGLPRAIYNHHQLEWYGRVNLLKGGMSFADAVVTVSPNHAEELRTPAGGFGLHDHFRSLGDRFTGIVNGIDQVIWNAAADQRIAARYTADDPAGKLKCRRALQRAYGLPEREGVPIFVMSARLVWQKGLDLILAETGFFDLDAQFIFLGAGEQRYVDALRAWMARAPDRVRVDTDFADFKEHALIAGGDVLLMPCQYEPCGLTQMRAQRYGTLPLVRFVGGLADTVENGVTGFVFRAYDPGAFVACAIRALRTYQDRAAWTGMVRTAMARDFDWERSEERYLAVYGRVMQEAATG
ncbi:MAG TPA: glycogen/starch synthase [Gemmatirosa sp.]|nr:glycogen/starch synthase [Gemmatirosa sp.]